MEVGRRSKEQRCWAKRQVGIRETVELTESPVASIAKERKVVYLRIKCVESFSTFILNASGMSLKLCRSARIDMPFELTLTTSTLLDWHEQLQHEPSEEILWPLGLSLRAENTRWLAPPFRRDTPVVTSNPDLRIVGFHSTAELAKLTDVIRVRSDKPEVILCIGLGSMAGHLAASFWKDGSIIPVDDIRLIGYDAANIGRNLGSPLQFNRHDPELNKHDARLDIWGPTREALSEVTWQRFRSQQFGVVGGGRIGSTVAEMLHRNGAQVTVVDSDRFEAHNLGESALAGRADVDQAKALVIAKRLESSSPSSLTVLPVIHSVLSLAALPAIKNCTVLISAVDNPTARLVIAILSTIYMVPLLDLGSGIFHQQPLPTPTDSESQREMGADIRLCLPGRCLLCTGGIHNLNVAIQELQSVLTGRRLEQTGSPAWFDQRSGSLRSLNSCAASFGLRLIEDWLSHRLSDTENYWLQLEFDANGLPSLQTQQFEHRRKHTCPLCLMTGSGDESLRSLPSLISMLTPTSTDNRKTKS